MKKNIILKMFLIFSFTSFILACKKETIVIPENKPATSPTIFAKWNWVQTVYTGPLGTISDDPQTSGKTIVLHLNSDSNFFELTTIGGNTDTTTRGTFKLYGFNNNAGGGFGSPATGSSDHSLEFNMNGIKLPVNYNSNFDTLMLGLAPKPVITYSRSK